MGTAFFWGAVGGAALILGAAIAMRFDLSIRVVGFIMAFGAGVLISAMAFDLIEEAYVSAAGEGGVALGFAVGALVYFLGDAYIDNMGGDKRKSPTGGQGDSSGLSIALGSVLDGIPESIVLGVSLIGGSSVSVPFVFAVLISNVPEGLAATRGLAASGWPTRRIFGMWSIVTLTCALASLGGFALLDGASGSTIAFVLAFAGGAILTMLADTMMPEAFEHSGKFAALLTSSGFAFAFFLHTLG